MSKKTVRLYYIIAVTLFFIFSCAMSLIEIRKMETVKLFLKERKSESLVIQKSSIPQTNSLNDKIYWILKELISGPIQNNYERIFDPNIEVMDIIVKRNTAYISFDWTFIDSLYKNPSLAIDSIVDSILLNVRELSEVKILIEGIEPVSTFCNISLQRAFQ
jgi:hypothetical protein